MPKMALLLMLRKRLSYQPTLRLRSLTLPCSMSLLRFLARCKAVMISPSH